MTEMGIHVRLAFDCVRVWSISRHRLIYGSFVFLFGIFTPSLSIVGHLTDEILICNTTIEADFVSMIMFIGHLGICLLDR